ncbi:response regulator [Mesorhizobium sp. CO1-1-11]|uniref:response regulator n=1 Tax=Mesorhizobium sp. CO1-1-11 TaxID=2876636 RepID=UPI001CC936BA|nr:response regulator [Mesorhizobium sp. CO1-1-11]MBZ9725832.1 response regulator [Mesorhizobium sp. CO1-1-11]
MASPIVNRPSCHRGAGITFAIICHRWLEHTHPFIDGKIRAPTLNGRSTMHGCKVLVAEDEPVILLDLEFALASAGFEVFLASNAEMAMMFFDGQPSQISALVTDIHLGPGKQRGWEVARYARLGNPKIAVVYVTADPAASRGGVSNSIMIHKPFFMAQVVIALTTLLKAPV